MICCDRRKLMLRIVGLNHTAGVEALVGVNELGLQPSEAVPLVDNTES